MLEFLRSDDNVAGEIVAVLLLLVPWSLALYGMYRGYRRQRRRDEAALGPLPTTEAPAREPDGEALYTGTTYGGTQGRKVAAGGLFGRGSAVWWLEPGLGLVFRRVNAPAVAISDIVETGRAGAHAGRVTAPDRVVIVRWRLPATGGAHPPEDGGGDGARLLDTGFAFPDAEAADAFEQALRALPTTAAKAT